jgi:hypothetical protein
MINEHDVFAFPVTYREHDQRGMTLRDYFAARVVPVYLDRSTNPVGELGADRVHEAVARAYQVADAMLKYRAAE